MNKKFKNACVGAVLAFLAAGTLWAHDEYIIAVICGVFGMGFTVVVLDEWLMSI